MPPEPCEVNQCPYGPLLQQMDKKLDSINLLITGNGHPEDGLVVKVDRHDQKLQLLSRVIYLFIAPVAGGAVYAGWQVIKIVIDKL